MAYTDKVHWIDVPLGKEDKAKLLAWYTKLDNAEALLEEFVKEGYKITISWDGRNNCWSVFVLPMKDDSPNQGCILTARSDHWWKAVMSAYYKHVVIMKRDWRKMKRPDSDVLDF